MQSAIWFTKGFANLYHALNDIRRDDRDRQFQLLCSHTNGDFVGLQAADVPLLEPASHRALLPFVLNTIKAHNVKVIFASQSQELMNAHRETIEAAGARVVTVATTRTLRDINDKGALYCRLAGKNLCAIPAFEVASTAESLLAAVTRLRAAHPRVCIKPTKGVYGSGFRVIQASPLDVSDMISEAKKVDLESLTRWMGHGHFAPMLVMQYLEGAERSVDCLAVAGRLVGGVVRRKSPVTGSAQFIENNPSLMQQVEALVRELGLNGMFNVQFKDCGGKAYLLEINPRMSGRSYYATVAGFNLPYLASQLFAGHKRIDELEFDIRTGFRVGNVTSAVVLDHSQTGKGGGVDVESA